MFPSSIKTVLLLSSLTALMLVAGVLLGGRGGLTIAVIIAVFFNFISYFFSSSIVLFMYGAKEVSKQEYPELHRIVEDVARNADIPKPKIYIVNSQTPNAFATGRNPNNAVVACTSSIIDLLTEKELRGVIAHEIAHVKHRDILITTIAATIAGVISYLALMVRYTALFGGFGRNDRENSLGDILGLLALAIITPLLATIIQLAISRSREFLADEGGARFIRDGSSLASALEKLEHGVSTHPFHHGSSATSSLFIVNPFSGQALASLLSTHPPTSERVKRLRGLKF